MAAASSSSQLVRYAPEPRRRGRRATPLILGPDGRPIPVRTSAMRRESLNYAGAAIGRRTEGWYTSPLSANTEIYRGLIRLRDRARDLIRNNPHASKAQRVFRSHAVGTGIVPTTKDTRLRELWKAQGDVMDADGMGNVYAMMALVVNSVFESGEVFLRKRARRPIDGLPLPYQVQVLESDHLDTMRNMLLPNGNRIVMGIEFDKLGRRLAYWMFPQHPGDWSIIGPVTLLPKRIPAHQIIHIYDRLRPGQIRGVPWLAPSTIALRAVEDWLDADLMRKTIEACIVGAVIRPDALDDDAAGAFGDLDSDPYPATGYTEPDHEFFEPGTWAYMRPGEDVKFQDPRGATDFKFLDEREHAIAAGAGVPYEEMTGNLSQVNFASYRAGRLSFWQMIREFQALTIIPRLCNGLWKWMIDDAILTGTIPRGTNTATGWRAPHFPSVNPYQDAVGDLLRMRMGGLTWAQYITEQGEDPDQQFDEIVRWNKKMDDAGVVLEGDPRHVSRSGVVQSTDPTSFAQAGSSVAETIKELRGALEF